MDDKAVSGVIVEVIIPVRIGDNNISLEGGGSPTPPLGDSGGLSCVFIYDLIYIAKTGLVIISRPNHDFGFLLCHNYSHKCIILVMDYAVKSFTRVFIINMFVGDESVLQ